MPTFEVELWENEFRRIPKTTVAAETHIQAGALGLADFRQMKVAFTVITSVDIREETEDEKQSQAVRVGGLVDWANGAGKTFVKENGLQWLQTFK